MRDPLAVTRRIHAERLLLVAWPRAILLQMAHPLVAAGVADHSTFRRDWRAPIVRLQRTVAAMLAITYGDDDARARAIGRIRAIHERVHGELPEANGAHAAGATYSAEDPALLLWVHATLLDSMVVFYERLVGPLSAADRDAYCDENAAGALELGADPATVPRTWPALQRYLTDEYASGRIVVGPQARELGRRVLTPQFGWVIWPVTTAIRTLTVALLPPSIRDEYGFAWRPRDERVASRLASLLHRVRRVTPQSIVWWRGYRDLLHPRATRQPHPDIAPRAQS